MSNPTDGHGVYEAASPSLGPSFYQPRLAQIAAGGFSLVLNYGLLNGHISDLTAYINYAASQGLKVIVALNDPAIWKTATYSTVYPSLYADSGNASTGILFAQYVVNQLKGLSGVWGWYVGDEITSADHTTLKTYSTAIASADNTHPRLFIASASDNTSSMASGANLFYDVCEVGGDDWYPLGDTLNAWTTPAIEAAGIQSYATAHSILPAMVLQAFSWAQYYPPARANNWPYSALWPTAAQMRYNRDTALAQGQFKLMLWYTYYNLFSADDPGTRWNDLCWAANNVGTQPVEPTILAESLMYAYANQSGWPSGWLQVAGTLKPAITSAIGTLTGSTDANILLLGLGSKLPATSSYVTRFSLSNAATGVAGIVFNYIDANNYLLVKSITNNTIQLVSVVAGTPTVLGSGAYSIGNGNRVVLKVVDTGTSYKVLIYNDTSTIEPSTLFTVSHSATATRRMQYGIYTQLGATSDTASFYNFAAFNTNPTVVAPVYYVSTSGNDSNPGTQSQPFATLQQAANVVVPGAKVYVQPGTYISGSISTPVAGTAAQRIQFIAQGSVTLQFSGVSLGWQCLGNYVDFIGFNITGDATLTNPVIFYGAFNTVQKSTISAVAASGAIGVEDFTFPSSDNQVIGCVLRNISTNNQAAGTGIRLQAPRGNVSNTVILQSGQAILVQSSSSVQNAASLTIANNLLGNNSVGGIFINGTSATIDNAIVSNNIFYGNGGFSIREFAGTGTHNRYLNNDFWQNTSTVLLLNGNTAVGSLAVDPQFVYYSILNGDYHLKVSSDCVNAGTSVGAPSTDADSYIRPYPFSGGYDIGPYQQHITPNALALVRSGLALAGVRP